MLAVYGTLVMCGGIVFFFFMLHLHRRPGIARWLETRAVGEITVFVSMMISLYGIAMIGRFGVHFDEQTFATLEAIEIVGIFLVSTVLIWKLYIPAAGEHGTAPGRGMNTGVARMTGNKAA